MELLLEKRKQLEANVSAKQREKREREETRGATRDSKVGFNWNSLLGLNIKLCLYIILQVSEGTVCMCMYMYNGSLVPCYDGSQIQNLHVNIDLIANVCL